MLGKGTNRFHWDAPTVIRIMVVLVIIGTIRYLTNGNKTMAFDAPETGVRTWGDWMTGADTTDGVNCSVNGEAFTVEETQLFAILENGSFTGWFDGADSWSEEMGTNGVRFWHDWCADEDVRVQVCGKLDETHTRTAAFDLHENEGYVLLADAENEKMQKYVLYQVDEETVKKLRALAE